MTIGESDYRGIGLGQQIVAFLIKQAETLGAKRVELGVFEFNDPARGLYKKCGFERIGQLSQFTYHDNRWWDDIRMEYNLQ
jgi:RimJ/RimL family protein N-acetyltransferase